MADPLVLLAALVPWIELRGSIPLGIATGLGPAVVLAVSIVLNIIVFFPVWAVLDVLYKRIENWRAVRWATRKALKHKPSVDRWGVPGLALFVAVPLPFTGAYTATLLAWLLRMPWRRAFVAIAAGVVAAGLIIFALSLGVLNGLMLLA